MDIIKIFTALNGFVKSCWRLLLFLTSRSWGRFPILNEKFTSRFNWLTIISKVRKRLTSGIANDRITSITGTDRFSNINCFDELANTVDVTYITDITDTIGKDGVLTADGLTSWLKFLLKFNGLISLLTLLALQTLRIVTLLEQRGLLTFNGLVNWLTIQTLQTLRLAALLEQTVY